ncbi:MAG: hypothetical protein M9928_11040 [Anaerolineae bacterium]|nr:hypothetical protein [Anaerolineae bacterium]MCO5205560.1 hypothetical protein [Anaerolineae bacterium]
MSPLGDQSDPVEIWVDSNTNFPLLKIDGLDFDVMWLPFTRVQLEHFLCDVNDMRFDAHWYTNVVAKDNPRVSPHNISAKNIASALATNLLLWEARRIRDWFGHEGGFILDLPTTSEWRELNQITTKIPAQPLDNLPSEVDPRAQVIIQRLQDSLSPSKLADQMLLNANIHEYVYLNNARQSCCYTARNKNDFIKFRAEVDQSGERKTNLTFRLVRRKL